MKPLLTLFFTLITIIALGQETNQKLIGSWVLTNRTYKSGKELPDNLNLKNSFIRFEFLDNGTANKSVDPLSKGLVFDYSVNENILKIGFLNYRIEALTRDSLILLEASKGDFTESSIRYAFIPEIIYQKNIPLTSDMMIISDKDTTYIENKKIRATFKNNDSFEDYISKNSPKLPGTVKEYFFMSTFIINPDGSIDSIKIHKGINKEFDNYFTKMVKKSEGEWIPGKLNGKYVKTLHQTVFYMTLVSNLNFVITNFEDGIILIEQGNFLDAINQLNIYLNSVPKDVEAIYNRGLCYYRMNDMVNARNDWQKIKNRKPYKSYMFIQKMFE